MFNNETKLQMLEKWLRYFNTGELNQELSRFNRKEESQVVGFKFVKLDAEIRIYFSLTGNQKVEKEHIKQYIEVIRNRILQDLKIKETKLNEKQTFFNLVIAVTGSILVLISLLNFLIIDHNTDTALLIKLIITISLIILVLFFLYSYFNRRT